LVQASVWLWGTREIGLPPQVSKTLSVGVRIFAVVAAIWTVFRLIDLVGAFLHKKAEKTASRFDDLLVPLLTKSLKAVAVCVGIVMFAEVFDKKLTGLLGGLGIGGAALAFASKDALGNFFGSITVLADRPFEIGDWVIVAGVEGSVETVGVRSTRIRTFYNSVITVPNSLLTTAVVDNMGRRRFRRIKTTIGVEYNTTPDQMAAFCEGIRELIRRHPYTRKDYYHVYFNDFGASSLDIMLYCFVECPDWSIELRERERLMLDIVRLAERLNVSFAFPTRTLHMYQEQAGGAAVPFDASEPLDAGRHLGGEIAGDLTHGTNRPGPVKF
jgi:MscS family membrane protein